MVRLFRRALIRHRIKAEPVTPRVLVSLERREIEVTLQFVNGAYNTVVLRVDEARELIGLLQNACVAIERV